METKILSMINVLFDNKTYFNCFRTIRDLDSQLI